MSDFEFHGDDSVFDSDGDVTDMEETEMNPNDAVLDQIEDNNDEVLEQEMPLTYNQLRKRAAELGLKFDGAPSRQKLEEAISIAENATLVEEVAETVDETATEQVTEVTKISAQLNAFTHYLKNDTLVQKYVGARKSVTRSVTAVLRAIELFEQALDKVGDPDTAASNNNSSSNKGSDGPFMYPDQAAELMASLPAKDVFVARKDLKPDWAKDDVIYWSVINHLGEHNQIVRGRGRGGRIARKNELASDLAVAA